MGYCNLRACLADLERTGQLVRIEAEIDPNLEMAEVQRRVYAAGGPALYFANVKGCAFPMASNLFGTIERTRFLFRDALAAVRHLVELKVDASAFWKQPWRYRDAPGALLHSVPQLVKSGPILARQTTISQLPQLTSWPCDGGAFVTLPLVYTEDVDKPGWRHSNLGMYRVQLSGNQYEPDKEVGLHYQIHRGIGVHHAKALRRGAPFRVNVCVGGPPALTLAAVMPLPEGLSELTFAGILGGRRVRLVRPPYEGIGPNPFLPMPAEADFVIVGTVDPTRQLPEGPFGDHLGYYSLAHDFPVLNVERVYHREGAVWLFTVVGRPPQEDTCFGQIIHELTGPIIPTVIPGVHAVHAVDATGVHPLLLAVGSERYVPYAKERRPQELLTCANAILGQGQLSLAKYLLIVAKEDNPDLDPHDIQAFFRHLLERVDWQTDLHFQTRTTIDTLDYSGTGLNAGSKVVIAAAGPVRRQLPGALPSGLNLPDGFGEARVCLPGVLAVQAPPFAGIEGGEPAEVKRFSETFRPGDALDAFPLVLLVDDSDFAARTLNNWLWVAFTRSNPAADLYGVGSFTRQKHWGCEGSLVIDARIKPHHAPPLVEDAAVSRRVEALAAHGGPLYRII
ncbi:MAG TPA: 3-octaprenyl-4-hydroxybenzoate carboxy-lyase [Planctomycetales bacterium]|jgi:4-hydroxy-3-polyprenylbenzoate decarboxylase|nr:3-octaprenyl-4-hydroxybenzoate carboxy-lyase [Planctomycetales bacterium]